MFAPRTTLGVTSKQKHNDTMTTHRTKKDVQARGTGHGARREAQRAQAAAARLEELARAAARAWVRTWEAHGGRKVEASTQEEVAAIYHAHAVRAWMQTGAAPRDRRALWRRTDNRLCWGALRAWVRAMRGAGSEARALMWGHGEERHQVESVEVLTARAGGGSWARLAALAVDEGAPAPLRAAGRRVRWARESLLVYHVLSGSRQWRASLADDLSMLAAASEAARGHGTLALGAAGAALVSEDGLAATGALRQRLSTLRRRIATGDALATERPTEAESALRVWAAVTV